MFSEIGRLKILIRRLRLILQSDKNSIVGNGRDLRPGYYGLRKLVILCGVLLLHAEVLNELFRIDQLLPAKVLPQSIPIFVHLTVASEQPNNQHLLSTQGLSRSSIHRGAGLPTKHVLSLPTPIGRPDATARDQTGAADVCQEPNPDQLGNIQPNCPLRLRLRDPSLFDSERNIAESSDWEIEQEHLKHMGELGSRIWPSKEGTFMGLILPHRAPTLIPENVVQLVNVWETPLGHFMGEKMEGR
jgi:hypothetical protein